MYKRSIIAGVLALTLTGCAKSRGEPKVETIGDVTPRMTSIVRSDMSQLIQATEDLKSPDSILSRLTDEYRSQLGAGTSVPCSGIDFIAFVRNDLTPVNGLGDILVPDGGLPPIRAPKGTAAFPADTISYNRPGVIDRWKVDHSHAPESILIANNGDVTASTEVWVYGDARGPIPRQIKVLSYSIVYRVSDMRIISFSVPCWYYFAIAQGEVDPTKYVTGFHPDVPDQPLQRQINGYTVTDEKGLAYIVAARTPNPQATALAPDDNLRQRAASITQVAIPYEIHNWRSVQWHSPIAPSIYTSNLLPVPNGLWGVISPYINYPDGESVIIQGYSKNSPLIITTTVPIAQDVIKKWWDTTQDSTWVSDSWLEYYLLGTVTTDPCPPGCLVIHPDRIVATSYQRIQYFDTGIIGANGAHPVIAIRTADEAVADYDPAIEQNLAKFQSSQHHPKPVSKFNWFPR